MNKLLSGVGFAVILLASQGTWADSECHQCLVNVQAKIANCLRGGGTRKSCHKQSRSAAQPCMKVCEVRPPPGLSALASPTNTITASRDEERQLSQEFVASR